MNNYKNTLNLPYTKFLMRGNLPVNELKTLKRWYKYDLYNKIRIVNKKKKKFFLHDGPPYANGDIHIGHSLNKILKDIIIKFKTLMGYDAPYIPGWDCHGLPIELKVEKLIKKYKKKINNKVFRLICRKFVLEQVLKQKIDFIRLGVIGDWKNSYLTMNFNTQANTIRALSKIIMNGHLYRDIKPVYWCLDCVSTLAEAEIEYNNCQTFSLYFIFNIININNIIKIFNINKFINKISIIIWTTNPWTLPSSRAITINPKVFYQLIKFNDQFFIIADKLVEKTMLRLSILKWKIFGKVKGALLKFIKCYHPFLNYSVPIVFGKYVTLDIGTGFVHTSPCHGPDDYITGKKYNLEFYDPVNSKGVYNFGKKCLLNGLHIFQANYVIINILYNVNSLLYVNKIYHSHPHCWRHKKPIIFRTTPQWFISMDKNKLREKLLLKINNVNFFPKWGKIRIKNMIINRLDWCISRQRIWGVPMSLFLHKKTNILHPNNIKLMELVANLVEINGVQAWWDLNLYDILGDEAKYYYKSNDTLDVWFDSGSTHLSVVSYMSELNNYKSHIYLEGYDQYRGWFMSSLITAVAIYKSAPYKEILTHGFVVDNNGYKMSKSLGNIIKPQKIANRVGADILRLWVSCSNYTNEISISNEIINHFIEYYRRIRNTSRFILANLNDFDPSKDIIKLDKMVLIDQWIINKVYKIQIEIINLYNTYDFHKVVHKIMQFCSIEMGSFYLDIIKDRLYTIKYNNVSRRSCQTTLYHIIESLVRWLLPIIPFTSDEIWRFIPGNRSKFIFTEMWYNDFASINVLNKFNDNDWGLLLKIKNEINKIIEKARLNKYIFSSLEAHIQLYSKPVIVKKLNKFENELHFAFLVSKVEILDFYKADTNLTCCDTINDLKIKLLNAKGKKCLRCWHYEINIGLNVFYPDICNRCILNITGVGENRKFI